MTDYPSDTASPARPHARWSAGTGPSYLKAAHQRHHGQPNLQADAASGSISTVATINVGGHPQSCVVNPNTKELYVVDMYASMSVIDTNTNQVTKTFSVDTQSQGMDINTQTNKIYVCNWWDFALGVVDGATNSLQKQIPLNGSPTDWGVAVNPKTNRAYVSLNGNGGGVAVIDTSSNTQITSFSIGVGSYYIACNPVTNKVYVVIYDGAWTGFGLFVIDGATNTIETRIPLELNACGVAVNSKTNMIYASSLLESNVQVFDGSTNQQVATVPVGGYPQVIAVNETLNHVYTSNYFDNTMTAFDGATNQVIATVSVGQGPEWVCANPDNGRIYVANTYGASVTVLQDS